MNDTKGFGLTLLDAIQNEGTVHHQLIQKVENITKRNLICYTSFFQHPAGTITDEDSTLIETLLKSVDLKRYPGKLDLLIHSPGGSPTAAEKIVLTCRSYAESFRVIVPKTAMSAATLVAMGADKIVLSETSDLGPIDPQMIIGTGDKQGMRPAAAFIDAYLDLINKIQEAIKRKQPPHPFLELIRRMDPTWIQICLKARDLSRTIARDFLGRFMLKGKSNSEINDTVNKFMKEGEEFSHGRTIRPEKAKDFGLKIELIEKEEELWNAIWELYMRCERYVQNKQLAKYLVGRCGGINIQVQRLAL